MKIKVNVSLKGRYDLLQELIRYFFVDEFDSRSSFCYDAETGFITMNIVFDQTPPKQIMNTIKEFANECINCLVFNGDYEEFRKEEEKAVEAKTEPIPSDKKLCHMSGRNNLEETINLAPESTPASISQPDNESSPKVQERKKLPARLLESAKQFGFSERFEKVYIQLLEIAYNLKEPITWKALKEAGFSINQRDERVRVISKIIKEKHQMRIFKFMEMLLQEEQAKQ